MARHSFSICTYRCSTYDSVLCERIWLAFLQQCDCLVQMNLKSLMASSIKILDGGSEYVLSAITFPSETQESVD